MRRRFNFQTKFITAEINNCKACWKCVEQCPEGIFGKIIVLWHKHIKIQNPEACIGCYKCVKVCNYGVISKIDKI